MTLPDCLQITVSDKVELEADKVDLYFLVSGSSWVSGKAALTQAREVSKLVADLITAGVQEKDIELLNVRTEVSSGVLGKSSSAHYTLRARCHQLGNLDSLLGAATAPKNVVLESLDWGYPSNPEAELERLDAALDRALLRARRMAARLGVELEGVHSLSESVIDSEDPQPQVALTYYGVSRSRQPVDLGVEVSHRKTLTHTLAVQFRVGPFTKTSP